jgi:hypothetical protein
MESYGCWYCTPLGEIEGLIEVLSKNKIAIFTPDLDDQAAQFRCIIHLRDVMECGVVTAPADDDSVGHYLTFHITLDLEGVRNLLFRFTDRAAADSFCRSIIAVKAAFVVGTSSPLSTSLSEIPYFSDHIDLSPAPSPLGSPSPPPALSPPPMTVNPTDKPAIEFKGSFLLTADNAADIREMLPLEHRFGELRLLFTPKLHGISIPGFFRKVEEVGSFPSIVILKDASGCCTFGAFVKAPWTLSRRYHGSPETFVFTLEKSGQRDVVMYGSGGANRLFQFADDKCLVIGGGSKKSDAAISIFSNWLRGTSGACETFGTFKPLCCSPEFVIGDIEFWSVLPDQVVAARPGHPLVRSN